MDISLWLLYLEVYISILRKDINTRVQNERTFLSISNNLFFTLLDIISITFIQVYITLDLTNTFKHLYAYFRLFTNLLFHFMFISIFIFRFHFHDLYQIDSRAFFFVKIELNCH